MNIVFLDALRRPIQKTNQSVIKRHNQLNASRSGKGLLLITHLAHITYTVVLLYPVKEL